MTKKTVRDLWKYEAHYNSIELLTPGDFVTWRVNWNDKVSNIESIAKELGFAPEAFVFIDDDPIERARVRQRLPEVDVWGDNLFELRRKLLNDPRLQLPRITKESSRRTELVRAQLSRQEARAHSVSEEEFIASLDIETRFELLSPDDDLPRIVELFARTTQFNTTGIKFGVGELSELLRDPAVRIFAAHVKDRFNDHGLVGAAIARGEEIIGLVLSCRVLGTGVEHRFLQHIMQEMASNHDSLSGRIMETSRNIPVRNLYRDNGFVLDQGTWRCSLKAGTREERPGGTPGAMRH